MPESGHQATLVSLNLINNYKTTRSPYKSGETNVNSNKNVVEWHRKQKTAYNTIFTGLKVAGKLRKRVRFLTLTTSELQYYNVDYASKGLYDSFRRLTQRIRRMTIAKMIQQGYLKPSDARRYYPNVSFLQPFPFEYFKVVTNEGNGVIHALYKGEYLPYPYLVDNWQDIHNSWDINIKLIRNKKGDRKRSAHYVVSQYVSNQESTFQRSSQSWHWLFRGYRREWLSFLNDCHNKYYYNPVKRRFYENSEEVDIFAMWERYVITLLKPPPSQSTIPFFLTNPVLQGEVT